MIICVFREPSSPCCFGDWMSCLCNNCTHLFHGTCLKKFSDICIAYHILRTKMHSNVYVLHITFQSNMFCAFDVKCSILHNFSHNNIISTMNFQIVFVINHLISIIPYPYMDTSIWIGQFWIQNTCEKLNFDLEDWCQLQIAMGHFGGVTLNIWRLT